MGPHPASITILGGGTAGWMAACIFNRRWPDCRIKLVESSAIGIIGVGEGSTPQMKAFFDQVGISEAEWMPRCKATYKLGIGFEGWSNRAGHEAYFHPFPTELDTHTAARFFYATRQRRAGLDVPAHPDQFLLPGRLAARKLGPEGPPNFPFELSYGYHFDSGLVGEMLREVATGRGIEWLDTKIARVEVDGAGRIAALIGEDGGRHEADFFVDASGFRAMIIEEALGVQHLGFGDNLFNDSAVVLPTEVPEEGLECATRAIAMKAGWRWSIPLTHRTGNGYVFSSRYVDPVDAEAELREALGVGEDVEARHLKMRCGRVTESWASNCLAIGLAQGFLEPLEATALHIVLATVESFVAAVDKGGLDEDTRLGFNAQIARRYEGIRDYIVCHYRTALRDDTDYWRDATGHDHLSDSLKSIMTIWFTGGDLTAEVQRQRIQNYYNAVSWHCMLAGYGNFPEDGRLKPPGDDVAIVDMDAVERFLEGCAMNFPSHAEMLGRVSEGAK